MPFVKGYKQTAEHTRKISETNRAKGELHWMKRPEVRMKVSQTKLGVPSKKKGRPITEEHKLRVSAGLKRYWQSVVRVYKNNQSERRSAPYIAWRNSVFSKDNYTCQGCGDHNYPGRGGSVYLEAHHIKSWASYPELRYEVSNGITYCRDCHKETDNYGWKQYNENKHE